MRTYEIETGKYKREMSGKSLTDAAIKAFKKYPPKNPSILTRMRLAYIQVGEKNKGDAVWHYMDTRVLLKKAGNKFIYET